MLKKICGRKIIWENRSTTTNIRAENIHLASKRSVYGFRKQHSRKRAEVLPACRKDYIKVEEELPQPTGTFTVSPQANKASLSYQQLAEDQRDAAL